MIDAAGMMTARKMGPSDMRRLCSIAALVLCVMHLLALAGGFFQTEWPSIDEPHLVINGSIWIAPAVLVFLCRRMCLLVGLCAIPIAVNFSARMYYLWQFHSLGINSMHQQKGDWASWFEILMGTVSVPLIGLWLVGYLIYLAVPRR